MPAGRGFNGCHVLLLMPAVTSGREALQRPGDSLLPEFSQAPINPDELSIATVGPSEPQYLESSC
jgi:hypothetical protein